MIHAVFHAVPRKTPRYVLPVWQHDAVVRRYHDLSQREVLLHVRAVSNEVVGEIAEVAAVPSALVSSRSRSLILSLVPSVRLPKSSWLIVPSASLGTRPLPLLGLDLGEGRGYGSCQF